MQLHEETAAPITDQETVHRITTEVQAVERHYERLVLLVAPVGSGKSITLREVAKRVDGRLVNLNLELSRRLLDLDLKQRNLRFGQVLDELLGQDASTICLLRTEILFDPAFRQDPLRLLKQLSRVRTVVAAWSGIVEDGFLQYAEPGHPEHWRIAIGGLRLIELPGRGMQ